MLGRHRLPTYDNNLFVWVEIYILLYQLQSVECIGKGVVKQRAGKKHCVYIIQGQIMYNTIVYGATSSCFIDIVLGVEVLHVYRKLTQRTLDTTIVVPMLM